METIKKENSILALGDVKPFCPLALCIHLCVEQRQSRAEFFICAGKEGGRVYMDVSAAKSDVINVVVA